MINTRPKPALEDTCQLQLTAALGPAQGTRQHGFEGGASKSKKHCSLVLFGLGHFANPTETNSHGWTVGPNLQHVVRRFSSGVIPAGGPQAGITMSVRRVCCVTSRWLDAAQASLRRAGSPVPSIGRANSQGISSCNESLQP